MRRTLHISFRFNTIDDNLPVRFSFFLSWASGGRVLEGPACSTAAGSGVGGLPMCTSPVWGSETGIFLFPVTSLGPASKIIFV